MPLDRLRLCDSKLHLDHLGHAVCKVWAVLERIARYALGLHHAPAVRRHRVIPPCRFVADALLLPLMFDQALISIRRGFARSGLGTRTVRTPSFSDASTFSVSAFP